MITMIDLDTSIEYEFYNLTMAELEKLYELGLIIK